MKVVTKIPPNCTEPQAAVAYPAYPHPLYPAPQSLTALLHRGWWEYKRTTQRFYNTRLRVSSILAKSQNHEIRKNHKLPFKAVAPLLASYALNFFVSQPGDCHYFFNGIPAAQ
jgi:hypothetical protein